MVQECITLHFGMLLGMENLGWITLQTMLYSQKTSPELLVTNKMPATFLNAFTPITQAIGALFELVDRENYQWYNTLFHQLADNTTAKSIQTTN